jgi:hypothetical protein
MSELLSYFSHNPDNDFINSLSKSTCPEQIKHFVFLSLFLTMLSECASLGVEESDEEEEESDEEEEEEEEDGKRCGRNKES